GGDTFRRELAGSRVKIECVDAFATGFAGVGTHESKVVRIRCGLWGSGDKAEGDQRCGENKECKQAACDFHGELVYQEIKSSTCDCACFFCVQARRKSGPPQKAVPTGVLSLTSFLLRLLPGGRRRRQRNHRRRGGAGGLLVWSGQLRGFRWRGHG